MRRLLVPIAVLALVAAGCSGGDDDDVSASKGTTSSSVALAGDAGGAEATATAPPGGAPGGTTAKGTSAPGATAAPTPSTAAPPPPPPGATFTAPGKYTYKVTGTSGGQPVNDTSTMTVDPPNGADQHSSQTTRQGTEERTVRRQADGIYLIHMVIRSSFVTKEFRFEPPALSLPLPPTVGRSWSWEAKSTDGKTTVKSAFKILRTENVDVGGQMVETVVLQLDVQTSGDFTSTIKSTAWASEKLNLIVRTDSKGSSPLGASDVSSKLQSTRPA